MKKRLGVCLAIILFAFCFSAFSGCKGPTATDGIDYGDFSVSFQSGTVTFTLAGKGKYTVYKSTTENGTLEQVGTAKDKFITDDPYSYFAFEKKGEKTAPFSYIKSSLGPNVKVFTPKDSQTDIQGYITEQFSRTGWDEFGKFRHSVLFMPGEYKDIDLYVGFYTSVAGLGYSPKDVTVNSVEIPLRVGFTSSSLTNFWRTVENFSTVSTSVFAVSQATSMRRLNVGGDLWLTWPEGGGYGSGGLIADSHIEGTIHARTGTTDWQQQWYTRNSSFGNFNGGQMNMVFAGTEGTLQNLTSNRAVQIENTAVLREKPFVVFDSSKGYGAFLPDVRYEAKGNSWKDGATDGQFIPLDKFYIARADKDTAATINAALENGKHLLFSPGIYKLDDAIHIKKPNTIVTGLGLATLAITGDQTIAKDTAVRIDDVDGVNVSGFMIEAGPNSNSLMHVGGDEKSGVRHDNNPICLSDIFFRSGGSYDFNVKVDTTLIVTANDVFGDNFWMWRADHSFRGDDFIRLTKNESGDWELNIEPYGKDQGLWAWDGGRVGWSQSIGRVGVLIEGDFVTMCGLMVEHYQEYQTIWNGENGTMYFYQSETPYDARQDQWMRNGGTGNINQGWASYKIGDHVQNHTAYGVGVYFVDSMGASNVRIMNHGIEAPANPGIEIRNMVMARFKGTTSASSGTRYHINISGTSTCEGVGVYGEGAKSYLSSYIGGVVTP